MNRYYAVRLKAYMEYYTDDHGICTDTVQAEIITGYEAANAEEALELGRAAFKSRFAADMKHYHLTTIEIHEGEADHD